jgi:hypothetical protein
LKRARFAPLSQAREAALPFYRYVDGPRHLSGVLGPGFNRGALLSVQVPVKPAGARLSAYEGDRYELVCARAELPEKLPFEHSSSNQNRCLRDQRQAVLVPPLTPVQ